MMSKNLRSLRSLNTNVSRCLASHAAKASTSGGKPGEVKVTTLPSGLVLAAIQSDSPLARVAVVVRAGARYEPPSQLGLTHTLRSAAGLSSERYTGFGITRNIEYFGGRLSVTGTRDTISYLLEAHNDEEILERNLSILSDVIARPAFKPWELSDNIERINADLSLLNDTPYIQLAEALHSVAFKGGLRKSLYSPKYMVGKHTSEALSQYVKERFVGPNTVVVSVGLEQQELVELVGKNLGSLGSSQASKCKCSYIGGEVHIDSASPLTYVALATEGAGLKNPKDVLTLSLFQTILGTGSQIKNSYGLSQVSRLGRAVGAALSGKSADNVAVSAFNFNYEETGLFGINVIAPSSQDVTGLVKAAVKELRAAAGSVNDAELADAKKNLKTAILLAVDQGDALALEVGQQLLLSGQQVSPLELAKQVDSITAADIKSVASKLVKGKPTLATVGQNAPYLVDIVEGQ